MFWKHWCLNFADTWQMFVIHFIGIDYLNFYYNSHIIANINDNEMQNTIACWAPRNGKHWKDTEITNGSMSHWFGTLCGFTIWMNGRITLYLTYTSHSVVEYISSCSYWQSLHRHFPIPIKHMELIKHQIQVIWIYSTEVTPSFQPYSEVLNDCSSML